MRELLYHNKFCYLKNTYIMYFNKQIRSLKMQNLRSVVLTCSSFCWKRNGKSGITCCSIRFAREGNSTDIEA